MPTQPKKRSVSTEDLEKRLGRYNSRINQIKTIQLQRQTELNLILNDPEAWMRSQNFGKRVNPSEKLEARKEWLTKKIVRLDILLMKAEGGVITQGMFDYGRDGSVYNKDGKVRKNFINTFNLKKPDGSSYVVGDKYIPLDTDRFTLIENIEEILEDRALVEEIGYNKEEANKDFPMVEITDPNNKYKTIKIDEQDYYEGTDFRNEQKVIDSIWMKELEQQRIQMENNESKLDLTKELKIGNF